MKAKMWWFFQGNEASYALDMCSHCEYSHPCCYFILNVFTVLAGGKSLNPKMS